jgi:phosphoribosyl-ATP pyrophosphohydrolase/phosphoribosyl-AMP cyclohydrolase
VRLERAADAARIDFGRGDGLVPVIAQHAATGEVLMLAYASREAVERTLAEGRVWFHSRSRDRLWRKGESSGHELRLRELWLDCDADTLLALVEPAGPTCHTGTRTCFGGAPTLRALADTIAARAAAAGSTSYTARLLADENLRLKKLGEEAAELVLACAHGDRARIAAETADLWYHALVACQAAEVTLEEVLAVLEGRRGSAARTSPQQHPVEAEQHERAQDRDPE